MSGDKGYSRAVEQAVDTWDDEHAGPDAEHAEADAEQLAFGLFGEAQTESGQAKVGHFRRGPGRQPGSRNRRTEKTVAFLLSRHRDPRQVLMEIAEASVGDLAALLNCTLLEAMGEKRLAAAAVLPFVAARLTPETVVNDHRRAVHLHINTGFVGIGDGGGDRSMQLVDPHLVEHHQVEDEAGDDR